jgi:twinfilin-like protein
VPRESITSSSDFYADLNKLTPYLKSTEALYILLRLPNGSSVSPFAAVTYVPDAAPVRQKMLFASTRIALVRELGSESFAETVFCTTAAELTPEGWKRHEAHGELDQPLTEEERNLVDLKEAEASEIGGTARRGAGYGVKGGKHMDAGPGVVDALKGLEDGDLVMLKIDSEQLIVLEDPGRPVVKSVSAADLASHIDSSEPRYSYFKLKHSALEGQQSAVLFIYTCPTPTKVRDRMIYASSRRSAEVLAETEAGVPLAKKVSGNELFLQGMTDLITLLQMEATDPSDITASTIESEFAPKQEEKSGFARPKRPGRR